MQLQQHALKTLALQSFQEKFASVFEWTNEKRTVSHMSR